MRNWANESSSELLTQRLQCPNTTAVVAVIFWYLTGIDAFFLLNVVLQKKVRIRNQHQNSRKPARKSARDVLFEHMPSGIPLCGQRCGRDMSETWPYPFNNRVSVAWQKTRSITITILPPFGPKQLTYLKPMGTVCFLGSSGVIWRCGFGKRWPC